MYCKWTDALTTVDNKGPLPSLTDYIAYTALKSHTHSVHLPNRPDITLPTREFVDIVPTQEFVFTIVHAHRQTCYTVILRSTICPFQTTPLGTLSESVNMLPQEGMLTLRRRLQYRVVWYRGVLPWCPSAPFFLTVCLSQPRRPISVTSLIKPTLPYQGKQQGRKG